MLWNMSIIFFKKWVPQKWLIGTDLIKKQGKFSRLLLGYKIPDESFF